MNLPSDLVAIEKRVDFFWVSQTEQAANVERPWNCGWQGGKLVLFFSTLAWPWEAPIYDPQMGVLAHLLIVRGWSAV